MTYIRDESLYQKIIIDRPSERIRLLKNINDFVSFKFKKFVAVEQNKNYAVYCNVGDDDIDFVLKCIECEIITESGEHKIYSKIKEKKKRKKRI